MHPVIVHRGRIEVLEPCGGVFAPSPAARLTLPVYGFGPADSQVKTPIFTCPVSAIPHACWELLDLWWMCRALRALPLPGGALDQPVIVQRAFTLFETEEAGRQLRVQATGQAAGIATVLGAMFGR